MRDGPRTRGGDVGVENRWGGGPPLPDILPFAGHPPPQCCLRLLRNLPGVAGDSPACSRISAMMRSPGAAGFSGHAASFVSSSLTHAVAGSLAIGALSMCLIVTLTVLSIRASIAMPIPA